MVRGTRTVAVITAMATRTPTDETNAQIEPPGGADEPGRFVNRLVDQTVERLRFLAFQWDNHHAQSHDDLGNDGPAAPQLVPFKDVRRSSPPKKSRSWRTKAATSS